MKVKSSRRYYFCCVVLLVMTAMACKNTKAPTEIIYENREYPAGNNLSFKAANTTKLAAGKVSRGYKTVLCEDQKRGEICWVPWDFPNEKPEDFLRISQHGNWEKLFVPSPLLRRFKMASLDCLSFATAGWQDEELEYRNTFQFCETIGIYSFTQTQAQISDNFEKAWVFHLVGDKGLLHECSISEDFDFSLIDSQRRDVGTPRQIQALTKPWIVCPKPR
jgi:hypothetical protein